MLPDSPLIKGSQRCYSPDSLSKREGNRPRPPGSGDLEIDQEKSDT